MPSPKGANKSKEAEDDVTQKNLLPSPEMPKKEKEVPPTKLSNQAPPTKLSNQAPPTKPTNENPPPKPTNEASPTKPPIENPRL